MIDNITNYKVEHFFNTDFVKDTIQISILKNPEGYYDLFDKYLITPKDKKYYVEVKHSFDTKMFYSLQNAVTWCIFENKKKFSESSRIESLDKIIESLDFSIKMFRSMISKTKDEENLLIYSAKLSQDTAKKQVLLKELTGYKNQAKYWQTHNFMAKA